MNMNSMKYGSLISDMFPLWFNHTLLPAFSHLTSVIDWHSSHLY